MTANDAIEMTPEQLRAELARAQEELEQRTISLQVLKTAFDYEVEARVSAQVKLADACAMRDALADEANELEEARDYNASLVVERDAKLAQAHAELKDLQGANRALAQQLADETSNCKFWHEAALKAENKCDEWRRKAQSQSDEVQRDWLSPVEAEGLKRQLAKTEAQLAVWKRQAAEWKDAWKYSSKLRYKARKSTAELVERLATLDATEALLKVSNAKLQKRQGSLDRACIELDAAEAALADCGIGGIFAEFDGLADAVDQMAQHIKELNSKLTQARAELADARLAAHTHELSIDLERQAVHIHSKAADELAQTINTERRLRQEAEHYADSMRTAIAGVHEALDECQVRKAYGDDRSASARARIFWLNQRAECAEAELSETSGNLRRMVELNEWSQNELNRVNERAEVLAQLVNEETATLLERLGAAWVAGPEDKTEARALAARIRETLALEVNDEG